MITAFHKRLVVLITFVLIGCKAHDAPTNQIGIIPETKTTQMRETVLHLVMENNSRVIVGKGSCNLSASRKTAGGWVKDDDGNTLEKDSVELIGIEANGFNVRFQLNERVGGTMVSNNSICFFPYDVITRTQLFNSMQVTGEFRQ
ncbi:MAG TPA: hypothetical protein VF437_06695 [Verrucomicrobiae bacterium]|jgi:hypothetical protein